MICMSRRRSLSWRLSAAKTLRPSKVTSPLVAGTSRRIVRPTVVLPQPLSPTSPSVSPCLMVKLTFSTACTQATVRCSRPPRTGKYLTRFFTSTRSRPLLLALVSALDNTLGGLSTACALPTARWRPGGRAAGGQRGLVVVLGAAVIQPAAHAVIGPGRPQLGQYLGADGQPVLHARPAARRKAAALRQVHQVRHRAGDNVQLVLHHAQHRDRPDQPLGVG